MTYNESVWEKINWWKELIKLNPQFTKEEVKHCNNEIAWNKKQLERK